MSDGGRLTAEIWAGTPPARMARRSFAAEPKVGDFLMLAYGATPAEIKVAYFEIVSRAHQVYLDDSVSELIPPVLRLYCRPSRSPDLVSG